MNLSCRFKKEKSKYMIFHVPRKEMQTLTLKIDNIIIEQVDELNFLGLTLDTNLTWKTHVNTIANKCSKTTGVFKQTKACNTPRHKNTSIQFSNPITY